MAARRIRSRSRRSSRSNLPFPTPEPGRPTRRTSTRSLSKLIVDGAAVDAVERTIGFRRLESEKRATFAERRALLHVRRARSGLASRGRVPAAERGVSRAAIPQRQGDGAQHAALPRQDSRTGSISIWPTGSASSSGSTCPTRSSSRPRRARRCGTCSGSRSQPRASSGRSAIWTLFNEGWGIDLDDNPDDRRWLIETFDCGEGAGPRQPARRQLPLLSAQLPPQDRHRGLSLVQRLPAPERSLRRDGARLRRARGLGVVAAWRRAEAGRRAARLLGVRRLGTAASARYPREGRRRALVVRERPRVESGRRLSARDRDALPRRRARADFRRSRRLRRTRRRSSSTGRSNTRSRPCAGSGRSPAT